MSGCQYGTARARLEEPTEKKERTTKRPITREVALSLEAIWQRAKDGLLALCMGVGLDTLELTSEKEPQEKVSKKGNHEAKQAGSRHSHEPRKVVLGGRKVEVSKSHARMVDCKEVTLETHEVLKNDEILTRNAFERMLYGLSMGNSAFGVEDVEWRRRASPRAP